MPEVLIKPAGKTLSVEPVVVDLSAASFRETLAAVKVNSETEPSERDIERARLVLQFLPADSFTPIRFTLPSDPKELDDFFTLLREINTLNEMMGGNGIDIESVQEG